MQARHYLNFGVVLSMSFTILLLWKKTTTYLIFTATVSECLPIAHYGAVMKLSVQYNTLFWDPGFKNDIDKLECIQEMTYKNAQGLESLL